MARTDYGLPGVYNATPITLPDGSGAALALDTNGYVKVNVAVGGSTTSNGTYNATPPTLTDTATNSVQLDINANTKVREQYVDQFVNQTLATAQVGILPQSTATLCWTQFQNLGANATLNVKATPGNVKSVWCHNVSGGDRYFQLHNTATTPSGGAVPARTYYVPAGGVLELTGTYFGEQGINFSTGIAFAVSTTEATYTAATATDHITEVNYK